MMSNRPTVWNRVLAKMGGEVSADSVEAYRRASLVVYEAQERAQAHRRDAREDGRGTWAIRQAHQIEMLCAWNAFALQTLGDSILQAKNTLDPLTAGFVPPATEQLLLRFYSPIEGWLSHAGQAHHNPDYRPGVPLPSPLPSWGAPGPAPEFQLRGLLDAMRLLRDRAEADFGFLDSAPATTPERQRQLAAIRSLYGAATFKARYADDMAGASVGRELPSQVEGHVKEAIEGFFHLGQLVAFPALATDSAGATPPRPTSPPPISPQIPSPAARPVPGNAIPPRAAPPVAPRPNPFPMPQSPPRPAAPVAPPPVPARKFDIWCLTDPEARAKLERAAGASAALERLWDSDPDPDRTLSIQARIDQARQSGMIAFATDVWGTKLDHAPSCPWPPTYTVRRDISIGGQKMTRGQRFSFQVSCGSARRSARFQKEIVVERTSRRS